jgi:hypothetical protein
MEALSDMLDDARLRGRTEAETFDRELRERELREREARLTRLASGIEEPVPLALLSSERGVGTEVVWRLQQDVERLAAFHRAVLGSKAWKLIQLARRPFGRSW